MIFIKKERSRAPVYAGVATFFWKCSSGSLHSAVFFNQTDLSAASTSLMKKEDRNLITKLISSGETAKAIEQLTDMLERSGSSKEPLKTLYGISARFHQTQKDKTRDVLAPGEYNVQLNRINADLLDLLDQMEKPAKKPARPSGPARPAPKTKEPEKTTAPAQTKARVPVWLWMVGIAAAAATIYFINMDKPVEVQFPKICWLVDYQSRCCPESHDRIRVEEAKRQMVVAVLLNQDLPDPYISGVIYDQNRNIVPIRQLRLTQAEGAICYTGFIERSDLYFWAPGRYTIEFTVNQQAAGSMNFTVIP